MKNSGSKAYTIQYLKSALRDKTAIAKSDREIIAQAIAERLTTDPLKFGKPLQFDFKGHRSLRVGNYRVIYQVDSQNNLVIIVAIGHRKDIYN